MLKKNYYLKISFILLVSVFAVTAYATTGTISTPFTTKVCHDATCTTPTPGILNFKPTGVSSLTIDSVTGISGKIWGSELGWITMNPTGQGVTFSNATSGILTGKAWSQVSGWINFAVTGQQVLINPSTGEFSGWAWSGGPYGGWIHFDCSNPSTCVKTTWTASSGGGGGGGGGGVVPLPQPVDVCPNLVGSQSSLPTGYTVDQNGNCIFIVDVCPNIAGNQETPPVGFAVNDIGACIPIEIDYCPNISGKQISIPNGYIINSLGDCIIPKTDACPNVPGLQSSVSECTVPDKCINLPGTQISIPNGYSVVGNSCFPNELDICKNIPGNQPLVPEGDILTDEGSCIEEPIDLCPNLGGYQSVVPKQFELKDSICIFVGGKDLPTETPIQEPIQSPTTKGEEVIPTERVIAYPFIPKSVQIPSDNSAVKRILKSADEALGTHLTDTPYKVDMVTVGMSLGGFLLGVWVTLLLLRRLGGG